MLVKAKCPYCGKEGFIEIEIHAIERKIFDGFDSASHYLLKNTIATESYTFKEVYEDVKPLIASLIRDEIPKQRIIKEIMIVYGIVKEDAEKLFERVESEVLECNRYT